MLTAKFPMTFVQLLIVAKSVAVALSEFVVAPARPKLRVVGYFLLLRLPQQLQQRLPSDTMMKYFVAP